MNEMIVHGTITGRAPTSEQSTTDETEVVMSKANDKVSHKEHQPLLTPVSRHFVDKVKMLSTLGYTFNASGVTIPTHKRVGRLVYKARKDTHTFFEGILYQDRKTPGASSFTPVVNENLMWVDYPRCWKAVSVWIVTKDLVGVQCRPRNWGVVAKREGRATLSLWVADTWEVVAAELPKSVQETLLSLRARMGLPDVVTVDCLDDQVMDVHSGNPIAELDPKSDAQRALTFTLGYRDRPFYDAGVLSYSLRFV